MNLFDFTEGLKTIHSRHPDIKQDKGWAGVHQDPDSRFAILCEYDREPFILKDTLKRTADTRLIVDY